MDPQHECNPVAIAILRVAMTAYEAAIGPLVKARAKSKCAAHATFSCVGACTSHLTGGARRRSRASRYRDGYTTAAFCLATR